MAKRVEFLSRSMEYIDSRVDVIYRDYMLKKREYIRSTKELFAEYEDKLSRSVIPLDEFGEIDSSENYSTSVRNLITKARRTGVLQLSDQGLTQVPEFVWIFGVPAVCRKESDVHRKYDSRRKLRPDPKRPLVYLDLSRNDIKEFEPKAPLEFVEVLNLSHCKLASLSEKLLLFRNLKVLVVGNNVLLELPSCLGYLDNLEEIDAQTNYIANLPFSVANIKSLKKLDISRNQFTSISSFMVTFKSIEELRAHSNVLMQIAPGIQLLGTLKFVDVSNNRLKLLPDLSYMPNLQMFNASNNELLLFPNFTGCKSLTIIHLESNRIQELNVECLRLVPVAVLIMTNNKLLTLPENIDQLSSLEHLDVLNNKINRLPSRLGLIAPLRKIAVEGNPIENVDKAVLKSTDMLLEFLGKEHARKEQSTRAGGITGKDKFMSLTVAKMPSRTGKKTDAHVHVKR